MSDLFSHFGLVTVAGAIIGVIVAYLTGRSKGKATAEKKAEERETQIKLDAEKAVAKRQTETAKEASDVKDTVSRMPDSAVDDELRNEWLNKS